MNASLEYPNGISHAAIVCELLDIQRSIGDADFETIDVFTDTRAIRWRELMRAWWADPRPIPQAVYRSSDYRRLIGENKKDREALRIRGTKAERAEVQRLRTIATVAKRLLGDA